MFDMLYKSPRILARHRNGPLAAEREAFLRKLADEGTKRSNLLIAASYLLIVAERLRLADSKQRRVGLAEVKTEAAHWSARKTGRFKKGPRSDRARQRFTGFALRWLSFVDRFEAPETPVTPFDEWIDHFADHLRCEKGLNDDTIAWYCSHLRKFLCRLDITSSELSGVTIGQVERTLTEQLEEAGWARKTVQLHVGVLRGFFRLAERNRWAPRGIADAIDSPRIYHDETLPGGPSWDDVQRLIATTDDGRPIDIRDRAILLLLAVYGLRAGEVVRLTLESLDWSNETLSLQRGKTRKAQTFPLSRTVGDAIARYLRKIRPQSPHRELFLRFDRPLPLRSGGLTRIVQKRLKAANISLVRSGAHALRHACATRLLDQGFTLKEIGDHLGHESLDSTRIYAKVNIGQLRHVADLDLGGMT